MNRFAVSVVGINRDVKEGPRGDAVRFFHELHVADGHSKDEVFGRFVKAFAEEYPESAGWVIRVKVVEVG
jgi:hypothetical protein